MISHIIHDMYKMIEHTSHMTQQSITLQVYYTFQTCIKCFMHLMNEIAVTATLTSAHDTDVDTCLIHGKHGHVNNMCIMLFKWLELTGCWTLWWVTPWSRMDLAVDRTSWWIGHCSGLDVAVGHTSWWIRHRSGLDVVVGRTWQ